MKRVVVAPAVGALFAASVALSWIHPWGDLRSQTTANAEILAGSNVPPEVKQVLQVKCGDCHSNGTRWPFYSRFAPGSWLMESDVYEARLHLNFSDWPRYDAESRIQLLVKIAVEARSGGMPVRQYLLLHPEAKLTDAEKEMIYAWAKTERRRIRDSHQDLAPND